MKELLEDYQKEKKKNNIKGFFRITISFVLGLVFIITKSLFAVGVILWFLTVFFILGYVFTSMINKEIYNIFNVLCARIDISPKTNLDFQSDISKQVEIIFHHNEDDIVLVQQFNLEDINITFDIRQLITINKDIKQAIINCLKNQTINNGTKILIK